MSYTLHLNRTVIVEPGQELGGVPVGIWCFPVPIRPDQIWLVSGYKVHQLWKSLCGNKVLCLETRGFVKQVEGMEPFVQRMVDTHAQRSDNTRRCCFPLLFPDVILLVTSLKLILPPHLFLTAVVSSPTRSRWGPTSLEFQLNEVGDGQLVKPSWCLAVNTTYLYTKAPEQQ